MTTFFWCLLAFLAVLFAFYGGIVIGIADCKRQYRIAKGVTPEEFDRWIEMLAQMAYEPYKEVDDDGCICP